MFPIMPDLVLINSYYIYILCISFISVSEWYFSIYSKAFIVFSIISIVWTFIRIVLPRLCLIAYICRVHLPRG